MRKYLIAAFLVAAACLLPDGSRPVQAAVPATISVEGPSSEALARNYSGQVLLDVARHGEAWWVDPRSLTKVYLGRPDEALERLRLRAALVAFDDIARVAESESLPQDAAYAQAVAGHVLAPTDVVGAAWYVHPALKVRLRLATPDDAWLVMKTGVPVSSATLDAIAADADAAKEPSGEHAVKQIKSADTLVLDDDSEIRLISVDVPSNPELQQAAMDRIAAVTAGKTVVLEADFQDKDEAGAKLRFARVGDLDLSYDLVRNGLAFHNIMTPNLRHAEMLIVGGLDAMYQKRGFWKQK